MTLQASGPIAVSEIQAEFSAPNGTSLSALSRGGAYVPTGSDENSSIGTAGNPVQMTAFLGASRNPLSSQETSKSIAMPFDNITNAVYYLGTSYTGGSRRPVYVQAQSKANAAINAAAKYVVELKVRCGAGFTDSPGGVRMRLAIGLVSKDPLLYSITTLDDNFVGGVLLVWTSTGILLDCVDQPFGDDLRDSHLPSGVILDAASYATKAKPDATDYVTLRVTRGKTISQGSSGDYMLDHLVEVYDNDAGDWVTLWDSSNLSVAGTDESHPDLYNTAGWLVVCNYEAPLADDQDTDLDIAEVRCISGSDTSPW